MSTEPKTCENCGSTTHTSRWHDGDVQPRSTRIEAPLKFRKKPVEVEAQRFTGLLTIDEANALADWCGGTFRYDPNLGQEHKPYYWSITIPTLEGVMYASPGDWIIRGVAGEFYPCREDIFAQTYEQVSS